MIAKCEKLKLYSGVFRVNFFAFCACFFAFHILGQGWHLCEKSKDFVVYFFYCFAALIKYEIRMKYEKCIMSVLRKHSQNTKYEKFIADLKVCFPFPYVNLFRKLSKVKRFHLWFYYRLQVFRLILLFTKIYKREDYHWSSD